LNGALDEAMEIMKGSLADNSQVEQPHRTTGQIECNDAGDILNIYVKGILVDFEVRKMNLFLDPEGGDYIDPTMNIDKESENFYWKSSISSEEKPFFS